MVGWHVGRQFAKDQEDCRPSRENIEDNPRENNNTNQAAKKRTTVSKIMSQEVMSNSDTNLKNDE